MCKTLGRDLLFGLLKLSSWDVVNGEIEQKGRREKLWWEGLLGRKRYVGSDNFLKKDEVKGLWVVLRRKDRRPELMAPAPAATAIFGCVDVECCCFICFLGWKHTVYYNSCSLPHLPWHYILKNNYYILFYSIILYYLNKYNI